MQITHTPLLTRSNTRDSIALLLLVSFGSIACSDGNFIEEIGMEEKTVIGKTDADQSLYEGSYVDPSFGLPSPLGDHILERSQEWALQQMEESAEFAQPRMCAHQCGCHVILRR